MKQSRLFGIKMDKKVKIRIIVCGVLSVLCLAFFIVLGFFTMPEVVVVDLPSSELSQSVFDSQNMFYEEVDGYSVINSFQNVPYTISTVNGPKASFGYGNTYKYEPYYFYYSEIKQEDVLEEALKAELTDVLLLSAEPSDTTIRVLSEENGYLNGCHASFYVLELNAKKENLQTTAYMCLYRLHFDESIYETEWDMLVGCMTEGAYTTNNLSNLQIFAKSAISTLKYDKALDEIIKKRDK